MELKSSKIASLKYHDIFDYPLKYEELYKWEAGSKHKFQHLKCKFEEKDNFIFLENREKIIKNRLSNEKYSKCKKNYAEKVSLTISKINTIKFVGITGALAMNNSSKNSDIDLIIITKRGTLWLTRLLVYCVLCVNNFKFRRPSNKNQKDLLCLNMWLDESNLIWHKKDRNIYTAHEIAQIVPLVNNNMTYERFLTQNKWILEFWPNAVKICNLDALISKKSNSFLEFMLFKLQYLYMKPKITRETVTPTRALFHPNDWSSVVLSRFSS